MLVFMHNDYFRSSPTLTLADSLPYLRPNGYRARSNLPLEWVSSVEVLRYLNEPLYDLSTVAKSSYLKFSSPEAKSFGALNAISSEAPFCLIHQSEVLLEPLFDL